MGRTDLIADAFTMIRNAARAKKEDVIIPYSRPLFKITELLKENGYIENFKEVELGNFKKIKVYLKYDKKKSVLRQIKRVSRPGRRVYVSKDKIPVVLDGFGFAIVSTSSGIMADREAKEKGVGGEVIGMVW